MSNLYYRRPFSLKHEESSFHIRNNKTGIIVGAEPFYYNGINGEAVLMLHGYTSSPRDLHELGVSINKAGYTVSGILLPGHGTKPTDLDSIKWQDWYKAVKVEFSKLNEKYNRVHVLGFSMGGALAMYLASKCDVKKLILLSPFFKLSYNVFHLVPEEWLVYTIGNLLRHLKKEHSGNCNDIAERLKHIAYYHYSLSSINQALELVTIIRDEIKLIHNDTVFIHALGDKTTSYSESRRIFNLLTSKEKRFVTLSRSNHIITHDYEKEVVFNEVLKFLER